MSGRKRARRSRGSRLLEWMADVVLILVVLVFALSIATRYSRSWTGDPVVETPRAKMHPGAQSTSTPPRPAVPIETLRERPTVNVRNGSGMRGLAEAMTDTLRSAGFDVLDYRTADRSDYPRTLIKDRGRRAGAGARVRDYLRRTWGVGDLVVEPVETAEADVDLILGADLADTLSRAHGRTKR